MEIGWKLKKLYYYIENIFTKRVYEIKCDQLNIVGYNNKLIYKYFWWNKTIKCIETTVPYKKLKFYFKPLPYRIIQFKKYYPWYSFDKLKYTAIIYIEKGKKSPKIGNVTEITKNWVEYKNGKAEIKTGHRATIGFTFNSLLNNVICEEQIISMKDVIILGYLKRTSK